MIPDFPVQKARLRELWTEYVDRKQQQYLGFWSTLPSRTHHEGEKWLLERADGSSDSYEYRTLEAAFSIDIEEAPILTPDKVRNKLDEIAREMARQMSQGIYQSLNETLEKYGQTIDGEGRSFNKATFLEAIEAVEFDFDENGEPAYPALLMHPELYEKIKDDVQAWDQDPEFKTRHKIIMERKRIQWRDRESRRKLVD